MIFVDHNLQANNKGQVITNNSAGFYRIPMYVCTIRIICVSLVPYTKY